ncbi:MAG: adenosylmethionine decarboxylase [Phycisphaerae bacterium]
METRGTHCMVELYDCPPDLLNDEIRITRAMREAVAEGLADLLGEVSHQFTPQGVTALGLLAESHISIHTWPEHGYAAADVFTCGDRAKAEVACRYLVGALQAGRHAFMKLTRGTGGVAEVDVVESPSESVECVL